MRRFLLHVLLFSSLVLLGIGAYVRSYRQLLPAARVTPNGVLNMKLSALRHRGQHPCHVLALGSSMTMNNLSSPDVVAHFHDTSYVNMGAWGMDIQQSTALAHVLVPLLKPRTVLLMSNLNDLVPSADRYPVDTARVSAYLLRWGTLEGYLRNLKPAYYLREMERNQVRMQDHGNYEFMGVDDHGWAPLVIPPERIDRARWNKQPPQARWLNGNEYAMLADLSNYLHEQGARLVFIQSPYRAGVRNAAVDSLVQQHLQRVRALLEPEGHAVLDATDRYWPDSLFVDYSHLSERGAQLVTEHALAKLNAPLP